MDNIAAASAHVQSLPDDVIAVSGDTLAPLARIHRMPYGAEPLPAGGVCFRLWAPGCERIGLALEGKPEPLPMRAQPEGWHALAVADASVGARYSFVLPDNTHVPDPASRFQPDDVHGPSEVIDPAGYRWADTEWAGRPWHETVLYEVHVGAFTSEGSFRGAIERLDHLAALGVNAIELMPIADFPGRWSWGYDGVLLYAPDSSYGRPEDLKALVDAAHARGISVLLDVVYNHFGPDGNYLPLYVPQLFTDRHKTPWATPSTTMAPAAPRSASSLSTTRCTGSRNSIWTGCASMPCTPSSTTAPDTCSANSPNACAPASPTGPSI
jgi:1,4-alpha-glucan branching enzyme